jgi:PAS domain S-box-containing protein
MKAGRLDLPASEGTSAATLRAIADALPGAVYRYRMYPDGSACFTWISHGVEALIGAPRQLIEADIETFRSRVHPRDRARIAASIGASRTALAPWHCEFRIIRPDGQTTWLRGQSIPEPPAPDGTIDWNGVLTDITHDKRVEQELVRARNEWRATVDAVCDMIILEDAAGRIARCNRSVSALLGLDFPQILRRDLSQLFFGATAPSPHPVFRSPRSTFQFAGNDRWYEVTSYPLEPDPETSGWVHVISDVTERRRAEEHAQRFTAAIEQSTEAMLMLGPAGRIEYVNSTFTRQTGYAPGEVIGRRPRDLRLGPSDRRVWREILRAIALGRGWHGRYTTRRRDGETAQEEASVSPVRNTDGVISNYVVVGRDVTERERLEAVAAAVNMMDNVGFIFSSIRHELGNPVNSIKTALSVLREQIDVYTRETVIDYLDRTLNEIGRVEYLLKAFKTFNMFEHPRIEPVGMNRFLGDFLGLLGDDFGKRGITVRLHAPAGLGDGLIDPRALNQALLNLVTNAADAVEHTGEPRIILSAQRRGRRIFLHVADNGQGMGPEQLAKLFRPFFTAKQHGNGLGLAIVKKLVTKMGGTVDVVSALGVGTTVTLSLVAAAEEET